MLHKWRPKTNGIARQPRATIRPCSQLGFEKLEDRLLLSGNGFIENGVPVAGAFAPTPQTGHLFTVTDVIGDSDNNGIVNDPNLTLVISLTGPPGPFHQDSFIELSDNGQLLAIVDSDTINAGFINGTTSVFPVAVQLRGADGPHEIGFTVIRTTPGMSGSLLVLQRDNPNAALLGRFFVDTEPPTAPAAPVLTPATDPNDDHIIKDMTPTFEVTDVESGASAQLYRNGVPVGLPVVNESPDAGSALLTDTSAFPGDGFYLYTVRLSDAAGNTGPDSLPVEVTFDTQINVPVAPELTIESDTGLNRSDRVTYDSSPTLIARGAETGDTVELLRNGVVVPSNAVTFDDRIEVTDRHAPNGTFVYAIRLTDAAGNSATSPGTSVTIDTSVGDPTPGAPGTPIFSTQYVLTPANIDDSHLKPGMLALQPWTTTFDRSTQTTWFTVEQGSYLGHFDPATGSLELYDVSLGKTLTTDPHGTFFDFNTHITPRVWFTHRNEEHGAIPELSYLDLERNVLVTYNFEDLLGSVIGQSDEIGLHAVEVDSRGHVWVSGEDANVILELTFSAPDVFGNVDPSSEMGRVIVHRKLASTTSEETDDHDSGGGDGSGAGDGSGGGGGGTTAAHDDDDGLTHPHGLTVSVSEVTGEAFVWITELMTGRVVLLRPGSGPAGEDQWAEFDVDDFLDAEVGDPAVLDGVLRSGHALFVAIDNNETPGTPEDDKIIVSDPGDRRNALSQANGLRGVIRVLDPSRFLSSPDTVTTATIRSWSVPGIPGESATENFAGTNQSFLDREGTLFFIDRTSGVGRFDPAEDSAIVTERTVAINQYSSLPSAAIPLAQPAVRNSADIRTDYVLTPEPVIAQHVADNTLDQSPITGLDQYEVATPGFRRPEDQSAFRGALNAGGVLYGSGAQSDTLTTTVFAETARRQVAALSLGDGARMAFQVYRNGSVILTQREPGSLVDQQVNLTAQLAGVMGVDPLSLGVDGDVSAILGPDGSVHAFGKCQSGGLIEYRYDITLQTWSIHTYAQPNGIVFAGEPRTFVESSGAVDIFITTSAGHLLLYRPGAVSPTDITSLSNDPDTARVYASVGVVEDAGRIYIYGGNQTGTVVEYSYAPLASISSSLTTRLVTVSSRPSGQVPRDTWIFQNVEAVVTNGVRQVFGVDGNSRLVQLIVSGPDSGFAQNISQSIADTFSDNVDGVDVLGNDLATGYFPFQQPYVARVLSELLVLKDPRDGKIYVYGTNSGDLVMFSQTTGHNWLAANLTQDITSGRSDRTPANFVFGAPGGYSLPNGDRCVMQINADGEIVEYYLDQRVGIPTTQNVNFARGNRVTELSSFTADPQIDLGAPTATYLEQSPPVVVATAATLTDADSANFAGGVLTVRLVTHGSIADLLQVRNQGTTAGQIGVNGDTITYRRAGGGGGTGNGTGGGTGGLRVIGTFSGGAGLDPLTITLTENATLEAVQALLRNITFQSPAPRPDPAPRTVEFVITDGDGGRSMPVTTTVQIKLINLPTVLTLPGDTVVSVQGGAVLVSPSATVTDPDRAVLNGATLVVTLLDGADPQDVLAIRKQGNRTGQMNVRQDQLRIGSTVIGKFEGGRNGDPLVLTFNQNASLASVRSAIRQIQFSSRSRTAGTRAVGFVLTDGAGISAGPVTKNLILSVGRRRRN